MKKQVILYIFRRPVTQALVDQRKGKVPEDTFYGLTRISGNFKAYATDHVFKYKILLKLQYIFNLFVTRFVALGFSLIPALALIPNLQKPDIIFATADTYGLPLALFKSLKLFNRPLVFNTVGLYDGLSKKNNTVAMAIYKKFLSSVDFFVAGGSFQECRKLSKLLSIPIEKFAFIPFGIDTEFFKPKKVKKEKYILAIGADPSRDWELYKKVSQNLPNEKFHIITHKGLVTIPMPKNVSFEYNLSYEILLKRIHVAKCILILSKMNHHFAGQSTAFRCMSSGKAVIFTKTPGVAEYAFKNNVHCKMIPPNDLKSTLDALLSLTQSKQKREAMGKSARTIMRKRYNIKNYSKELRQIFQEIAK